MVRDEVVELQYEIDQLNQLHKEIDAISAMTALEQYSDNAYPQKDNSARIEMLKIKSKEYESILALTSGESNLSTVSSESLKLQTATLLHQIQVLEDKTAQLAVLRLLPPDLREARLELQRLQNTVFKMGRERRKMMS